MPSYFSDKENRMYGHIKEGLKGKARAEEIAARTVNKYRAKHGKTKDAKKSYSEALRFDIETDVLGQCIRESVEDIQKAKAMQAVSEPSSAKSLYRMEDNDWLQRYSYTPFEKKAIECLLDYLEIQEREQKLYKMKMGPDRVSVEKETTTMRSRLEKKKFTLEKQYLEYRKQEAEARKSEKEGSMETNLEKGGFEQYFDEDPLMKGADNPRIGEQNAGYESSNPAAKYGQAPRSAVGKEGVIYDPYQAQQTQDGGTPAPKADYSRVGNEGSNVGAGQGTAGSFAPRTSVGPKTVQYNPHQSPNVIEKADEGVTLPRIIAGPSVPLMSIEKGNDATVAEGIKKGSWTDGPSRNLQMEAQAAREKAAHESSQE